MRASKRRKGNRVKLQLRKLKRRWIAPPLRSASLREPAIAPPSNRQVAKFNICTSVYISARISPNYVRLPAAAAAVALGVRRPPVAHSPYACASRECRYTQRAYPKSLRKCHSKLSPPAPHQTVTLCPLAGISSGGANFVRSERPVGRTIPCVVPSVRRSGLSALCVSGATTWQARELAGQHSAVSTKASKNNRGDFQ